MLLTRSMISMENIIALQEEYIQQYIKEKSRAVFEESNKKLLGEEWKLIQYTRVSDELKLKCQYPHESGRTCNKSIKNIYTIMSDSGKQLKVGGSCLNKVVPVKKIDQIMKKAEEIKSTVNAINKRYYNVPKKHFTLLQKQEIIQRANEEGILPSDVQMLIDQGVLLPEAIYSGLEHNLFNLSQNRKLLKKQLEEERKRKQQAAKEYAKRKQTIAKREKERHKIIPNELIELVSSKPRHIALQEVMSEATKKVGIEKINTRGDAKKICEIAINAYYSFGRDKLIKFIRYSEVVREVGYHFSLKSDERDKFLTLTFEHAKTYLKENGFEIVSEKKKDFLFK